MGRLRFSAEAWLMAALLSGSMVFSDCDVLDSTPASAGEVANVPAQHTRQNVRPKHPDVPVLIFSQGAEDWLPEHRRSIENWSSGPLEFLDVEIPLPAECSGTGSEPRQALRRRGSAGSEG